MVHSMTQQHLTASQHPAPSTTSTAPASLLRQTALWTLLALICVLAWDMSGLDLPVARWSGNSQGFALQSNWFMLNIAHEGTRKLAWLMVLALSLFIWWPVGLLRQVPFSRRVQLVVSTFAASTATSLVKRASDTSCPWDLAEFGGMARYVSHWSLGITDGGGGHCFPAGHASAGFAFVSGYFALRHSHPRAARIWLALALLGGFALGLAQQMRGAHFMSHTLWTALLCWTVCWLCDVLTTRQLRKQASKSTEPTSPWLAD